MPMPSSSQNIHAVFACLEDCPEHTAGCLRPFRGVFEMGSRFSGYGSTPRFPQIRMIADFLSLHSRPASPPGNAEQNDVFTFASPSLT